MGSAVHRFSQIPWNCSILNFSPVAPPSSKGVVLTIMNVLKSRDAFDTIASIGKRVFLTVTSGENRKLPKAVVRRSDAVVEVPTFVLFKIPVGMAAFRFLVFTIPDVDPSFVAFTGTFVGLYPNLSLPKIVYPTLRVLFAANHNLVAGHAIKVAL